MKRGLIVFSTFCMLVLAAYTIRTPVTPYAFPKLAEFPSMPCNLANPVTNEGVLLGRYLFYDPVLSADSTMACASCHHQAAAFSDAPRRFSLGSDAKFLTRNTPPLFNLAWYPRLFWDGKAGLLEAQVFFPIQAHNEMNLKWRVAAARLQQNPFYVGLFAEAFGRGVIDSIAISKAIAQFERTLISWRSKYDRVIRNTDKFTQEEYEGFDIVNDMSKGDCLHCHSTDGDALGVIPSFSNNGLDKVQKAEDYADKGLGSVTGKVSDFGKFKVPTLRNVAITAPYMHDGRFSTLEEVIDFYSEGVKQTVNIDSKMEFAHQGGVRLTKEDKRKVLAFLRTLTDSAFISDPAFSNPFLAK